MSKLHECFRYEDGRLYWLERPRHHFKYDYSCRIWNKKFSGKPAGCAFKKNGNPIYMQVRIDDNQEMAHRVIWGMHYGEIPEGMYIDHINGCGIDNRIENLRVVSSSVNQRNRSLDRRNKSGVLGVVFVERLGKWKVQAASAVGERVYLGLFGCFLDACSKRKAFDFVNGYHTNHGRPKAEVERLRANQKT